MLGQRRCQRLGMRHHPDLRAFRRHGDETRKRPEQVRMQAGLRLVEGDESRQSIGEQRAGKGEVAQRAVGELARIEDALGMVGDAGTCLPLNPPHLPTTLCD
jgi:hypothetical protein